MGEIHELKTYPQYFQQTMDGKKNWECRKNDRRFHVGDTVILKEWDNIRYSGREIRGIITYILDDKFIGLQPGYVIFSLDVYDRKDQLKEE